MPSIRVPVVASTFGTVATLIVIPVIVAALTAIATMVMTRASEATNRRRDRYAEAVQTIVAWIEFPYRVRRRTCDEHETLAALANLGHDLQERLACHQAWIATEDPRLAQTYATTRVTVGTAVGLALTEAWNAAPIAKAAEMNLGDWGPAQECGQAIADLQHQIETRFGLRRLKVWLNR